MKKITLLFNVLDTQTISAFLLQKGFSSNNIFHEIDKQNVLINSVPARDKNVLINNGDVVTVILNEETNEIPLNHSPIEVLYEDEYLLIVNKPANLHVEPYKIGTNNNLVSMIANYFFEHEIPSKVHLVNRLDKCTSGIVIIAKNRYIKNLMCKTKIAKKYLTIVEGKTDLEGTINISIGKDDFSNSRKLTDNGKKCLTKYKTISYDQSNDSSLVEVEILTGRTHQIRLSFASIGHPLLGDSTYGSKTNISIYLNAFYTQFVHPITKNNIILNTKIVLPYFS